MATDLDIATRPWDRQEDEPEIWHAIFTDYYLPLGSRRSLRNAFEFYLRVERPQHYVSLDPENVSKAPGHWNDMALQFNWAERALQYDEEKHPDFGAIYVTQVLQYLQTNAMGAAQALVKALNNERTRVQAANSILNRSGVPEISKLELASTVTITSDDMARAAAQVEEWKTTKQSG